MSTWPAALPNPLMAGYRVSPQSMTVRTDMETGTPRVRRRSALRFDIIDAGFELSDAQMALFRTWFDNSGASTHSGTAQAGASSTITLATGASSVNSTYNNSTITITGGTGAGQTRTITGYVGSTRVATVSAAWATTPDASSVYDVSGGAQGGAGWFTTSLKAGSGGTVACSARFYEPWTADLLSAGQWHVGARIEVRYA